MPYLNAIENAMLPFAAATGSAKQKRERAMRALESVGLADKASRLPNQLSGGEQGRLAIARAIVNQAPLILADEPTGTLDTQTGGEIMEVFLSLNARGQTIFMVTHNPENARLAHRTVNMRDGRLIWPGSSPGRRSLKGRNAMVKSELRIEIRSRMTPGTKQSKKVTPTRSP
jgi:putative ABC transport system ATP-binding protein